MFTLRDKVTISGGGTLDGPVIIPVRKTLALGAGSQVTADAKGLESGGTIIIGNNGSFTVNGLSDITGDITFEGSGKLTLTGETKENVNNKIGNSTSKSIQIKGPASGSAEIILDGKAVLDFTGNVTATNVTINSSGKCSQINIPADKTLTIGSGASLVLNSNKDKSAAGDTGELKGIVTVKSGGAIIDENTNRGAWKVAEGGSIVIEYGGVGIIKIKDSDTTGTVLVGTKDEKTKSEYIQLVANRAKFTNKADEYLLTGPIVLAKTFSTLWKVVVEESFTIKTDATLDIGDNMIVGTGTGSKLVIEKDATVKGKHSIISGNNIGSSCFSAGTYDWVPVNGDTKAHWKLQQDES
jgi:hypothetical protein